MRPSSEGFILDVWLKLILNVWLKLIVFSIESHLKNYLINQIIIHKTSQHRLFPILASLENNLVYHQRKS